jgi:hypothetical protein
VLGSHCLFHVAKKHSAEVEAFTENQLAMFCSFHYFPQWRMMTKFVPRADLGWRRCLAEKFKVRRPARKKRRRSAPVALSSSLLHPSIHLAPKHHHQAAPARIHQFIYLLGSFPAERENCALAASGCQVGPAMASLL